MIWIWIKCMKSLTLHNKWLWNNEIMCWLNGKIKWLRVSNVKTGLPGPRTHLCLICQSVCMCSCYTKKNTKITTLFKNKRHTYMDKMRTKLCTKMSTNCLNCFNRIERACVFFFTWFYMAAWKLYFADTLLFQEIRCCRYLGNKRELEDGPRADSHLGASRTGWQTHIINIIVTTTEKFNMNGKCWNVSVNMFNYTLH